MKDSHGLYDYEAQEDNYKTETLYSRGSCKIYRDNSRFETVTIVLSSFQTQATK